MQRTCILQSWDQSFQGPNGHSWHLGSAPDHVQNHFSLHHDSAVCQLCWDILHCPVALPPTHQSCTSPENSAPPQTEPCKEAPPLESAATWTWARTTLVFGQRVILLLLNQIPFHSISLNSTRQKDPCWVLGRVSNTTTAWLRSLVISFLDRPKMLYSYPSRSPSPPCLYLASRCHGSQSMHVLCTSCCCRLVAKSCLTLCNPMDCSLPGSSVHGILQARILEWVAIFSPGDLPKPSSPALAGGFFTTEPLWHTWQTSAMCLEAEFSEGGKHLLNFLYKPSYPKNTQVAPKRHNL